MITVYQLIRSIIKVETKKKVFTTNEWMNEWVQKKKNNKFEHFNQAIS